MSIFCLSFTALHGLVTPVVLSHGQTQKGRSLLRLFLSEKTQTPKSQTLCGITISILNFECFLCSSNKLYAKSCWLVIKQMFYSCDFTPVFISVSHESFSNHSKMLIWCSKHLFLSVLKIIVLLNIFV